MKNKDYLEHALDDAEIDLLDELLISEEFPEASMDVSMMDGFMTALASGPNVLMPSDMLRCIWDADRWCAAKRRITSENQNRFGAP